MADCVAMDLYVAARHVPKLEDWMTDEPVALDNGIVQLTNNEVAWGRTDDIRALTIPFYGAHAAKYDIEPCVFAFDGKIFAEAATTDYNKALPACSVSVGPGGELHIQGLQQATEYWRVRKRAEAKMQRKARRRAR